VTGSRSKAVPRALQGFEVDDPDRVQAADDPGAFPGIEDHGLPHEFPAEQMCMTVEGKIVMVLKMPIEFSWVVDDDDSSAMPIKLEGAVEKLDSVPLSPGLERLSFPFIIVSKDSRERGAKPRHRVDYLALGDVAGVDHAIDREFIEDLDDLRDVSEMVVGVADDADPHGTSLPVRGQGVPPSAIR
jgi:hypothetical protein